MNDLNLNNEQSDGLDGPVDRVDELLSFFLDDSLDDQQAVELNELLLNDPEARSRSIDAAQLHADLHALFGEQKEASVIAPALPLPLGGMGLPTSG